MIRYSPPQMFLTCDGNKKCSDTYVIEDWSWLDIVLCKAINFFCNRLWRCLDKIGRGNCGMWFCDNIHIPISKWQDTRRYMMIFKSPEVKFEHLKGQKVWK